jgi:hypothetical protein
LCAYGGCKSASLGHLYEHKADGTVVEAQSTIILNVAEVSVWMSGFRAASTCSSPRAGARAESSGFSLHAGIAATASQRDTLEHLARYVARRPLATERLALTGSGQVRYALKTPYRDGTTHVIFEPEDFMARLAALVPKPRAHLTRYHGVFAPASPERARIVPATRAAAANPTSPHGATSTADCSPNLTWAQRLKRVFAIDLETCRHCGGRLRVIASIEQPALIERILGHLGRAAGAVDPAHPSRAPPRRPRLI